MNIILKNEATPLYLQIKSKIKKEIRTGILKPGDKLPSESEMQKKYNISRVTIRNAMAELESEGYIIKVQGKGSFVAHSDMLRLPVGVTSLSEDVIMQGASISSFVIKAGIEKVKSNLDKEFFGLDENGGIINGIPLILEECHFSSEFSELQSEDLSQSLYEIIQNKYKVFPTNKGRRSIKITFASEHIAEYLDVPTGMPVIESEMCVFDMSGEPVHTVKEIVRGDNDRFFKWYV